MNSQEQRFNFAERVREKEASRQADARALASGEKSREQLQRENGHFAGLRVRINFDRASPVLVVFKPRKESAP